MAAATTNLIPGTLALGVILTLATGATFLAVGVHLARRRPTADARLAHALFATWALAVGAYTIISGVLSLGGATGAVGLDAYVSLTIINALLICVALWGLMYYLVYLFTGRHRAVVPLGAFYLGFFALLTYYTVAGQPTGVEVGSWRTRLTWAAQPPAAYGMLNLALFTIPQTVGALAYATLYRRLKSPMKRYRVLLITMSILGWTMSLLLAAAAHITGSGWMEAGNRLLGIAAAVTIFLAYNPVPAVARRLNRGAAQGGATSEEVEA